MNAVAEKAPRLLKARFVHKRIFLLFLVGLILISSSLAEPSGLLEEASETIGCILIGICMLGRSYCSIFIGGKKNDEIVTTGPFSVMRNPLYGFSFIGILGMSMQTGMLTIIAINVIAFIAYHHFVVAREEAYLSHKFGQAYLDYQTRVPRWWPNFKLWQEAQYVETQPGFIRQTMYDSMIFILIFPLLELIEWLHAENILPNLIQLP